MGWSFILALLGLAALAVAMRSHHRDLFAAEPSRAARLGLDAACAVLLALSWRQAWLAWGWLDGVIGWLCLVSMAAMSVVALLTVANLRRRLALPGAGRSPGGTAVPSDPELRPPRAPGEASQ